MKNGILNGKKVKIGAVVLYLLSTVYFLYIGRYEVIYGAGVAMVIAVQLFGLGLFIVGGILSGWQWKKAFFIATTIIATIQISIIVFHRIERYIPTYTIRLPSDFSGDFYLLHTPDERSDVVVDENGIGYIGSKGKGKWRIRSGESDISEVLQSGRYNEVALYNRDSTQKTVFYLTCYSVLDTLDYSSIPQSYYLEKCVLPHQFEMMVEVYNLDVDHLRRLVMIRGSDQRVWTVDAVHSNL